MSTSSFLSIGDLARQRTERISLVMPGGSGAIPVVCVSGRTLAEAWENSLVALYAHGCRIHTEYDETDAHGRRVDPPSMDCSMTMVVERPDGEPLIHKAFPGGLEDLEEYRQEVLEGVKDHWTRDPDNLEDNRWEYTYHERLFAYTGPGFEKPVNQMNDLIEYLAANPHTRRCQAITWKPWEDLGIADPPCLQSFWFRLLDDDEGTPRLNMNVRFRSRDAYDAAFMNAFAFVYLMEWVAKELSERMQREVKLGRYVDQSDSYHIYGKRLEDFHERFLKQLEARSFEERTWTREFAEPFFEEARPKIAEKIAQQDAKYRAEGLL